MILKRLSSFFLLLWPTIVFGQEIEQASSWAETQKQGHGNIFIYWETSKPFIFNDEEGSLIGIEHEIMDRFKVFLKKKHNVDVNVNWKKAENFNHIFEILQLKGAQGSFGASAISTTFERRQKVSFSPSYMSDITVMISSSNVPIVNTPEAFDSVFNNLTAISIKGTTYYNDLAKLKELRGLRYKIKLIPSYENILQTIGSQDNAFGYIDLPIYLMAFKKNTTLNVRRQNLFPIKREGYGFIYPKNSDWSIPVNEFFNDPEVQKEFQTIISKYIDYEIYNFIERYYEDNISLLTKEKEIQNRELLNNALQIQQETNLRYGLTVIIIITLVFAVITYIMYQKRHKAAVQLSIQNKKIASQRIDIERQKQQLEKRGELMTQYNNEKNNLIKILAHDLRTPINHIQGLANIYKVENPDLSTSNADLIDKINNSAQRLLAMISKILDVDAIEDNRVNLLEEELDLNEVLSKVVNSFEKQAENKGISIICKSHSSSVLVKADVFYLTEVFENLISNALKFSESDKSVAVSIEESDNIYTVRIIDEGPGLSADEQKLLFNKFQTLSAKPTGGEQSTGLGLSIVKKYMELMGGKVWCESQPGHGATFCVAMEKCK